MLEILPDLPHNWKCARARRQPRRETMTITIRHIADKAGVSRGTVDRVLNG
ncbi:LacI family DNA-binding transcriptional regulator, partial [Paenibacillus sepulcri]|nr:LacI family DNA-binding transcriptional regulator [Paenibacillus sepulcri]